MGVGGISIHIIIIELTVKVAHPLSLSSENERGTKISELDVALYRLVDETRASDIAINVC